MGAKQPRISVIVPVYNETGVLGQCLERLSGRRDIDQVIVVDASRSEAVAEFYQNHPGMVLQAPPVVLVGALNRGRAAQMNLGADLSRADMLLFLHADTVLPGENLRPLLCSGCCLERWGRFDIRLDSNAWWARMIAAMMNIRSRLSGIATGDQALFIGRDLWCRIGGFAQIPLMEDVEICRRLKSVTRPETLRTRVTTSARRWQSDGVFRTIFKMWAFRLAFALGADPARLARRYRNVR